MNIAEKSMEKTRFYNREDLKAKDVARLISIWEGEAGAWEDFVDFFTSEKETASGTPYIDCYDIRELFENGDV